MHKNKGGKLKASPIWDYDYSTFGRFYDDFYCYGSIWNARLFSDPVVKALARKRWNILLPEFQKVLNEIEQMKSTLRESAAANEQLWPIEHLDINDDEHLPFDLAVDLLKQNLSKRMKWMSEHI